MAVSIPPRSDEDRPTWSVMVPAYNCAGYLERLLPEVVGQLAGRLDVQIEIVDDGSSDDPQAVVDRLGGGAVTFHRNPEGLGAVRNFNECIRRARGRLVHILHGDDMVKPGFYAVMERALADARWVAAVCRTEYVDDADRPGVVTRSERDGSGEWTGALRTLAVSNRVRPASIVVPRASYERVGGFDESLPHAADWEMWARLAAAGPVWFEDAVLARYRVHDESDTATRVRTGVNIRERLDAIDVIADLLPPGEQRRARRKGAAYSALFAARQAAAHLRRRDPSTAAAQLRMAAHSLVRAARP